MPAAPVTLLPCQRDHFEIPREVAYINCAYMGPLPRSALEAGVAGMRRKAQPWSISSAEFFEATERLRALAARLIGAADGDVAIVPSVSYGMGVAAANLPLRAGQRVLMLDEEFPSTIYPWREAARRAGAEAVCLPRPVDDDWTSALLAKMDERTAVVAVPVCHWTDGGVVDLVRVGDRAREVGAALAIDATQSLGVLPFDVALVRPDFLVSAAYKWLLGPYTIAFLYVAPPRQDGQPLEHNWMAREGSEDFSRLTGYRDGFRPGARRFDMGEVANFTLLPQAIAALELILGWEVPRIAATAGALANRILEGAAGLGFTAVRPDRRAPHYLGLRRTGGIPAGLGEALQRQGVFVSTRGAALRVTPHVYNDEADVARFLGALPRALDAVSTAP
ncbi:MAG TPA: aminotransferase class V-fold PLP-dependent enzyme [Gemmatimonadales bacterium]